MMNRGLLLILAVLILHVNVEACSHEGAAGQDTPAQSLGERLNKSQYVVEKGELVRRQGSVAATSTPLSQDGEFQVVKKALVAAKAKATIVEGARVVISDGKEYYEVIIGNPLRSRDNASDYTAKVMIDKKSLEVVWVEMNDMKKLEADAARKIAQFRDLSERLTKSEYVVQKGELARRPGGMTSTSTSLTKDQEFEIMKKGLKVAKAKLTIADGEGVVINENKEHYEVTIGNPPTGVRGPDYTARVIFDKKSLEIVEILSGG